MGLREDQLGLHIVIQKLFSMFVENFQEKDWLAGVLLWTRDEQGNGFDMTVPG